MTWRPWRATLRGEDKPTAFRVGKRCSNPTRLARAIASLDLAGGTGPWRHRGIERSELPIEAYENGPVHVYVALSGEQAVCALRPDMGSLAALGPCGFSCFAGAERRVKTRMFAPALGVAEDPATGSAAGPLALHLCRHGRAGFGEQLEISQGAEIGRPSLLHARVEGSIERTERVIVGGSAVIVARGEYLLS